MNLSIRSTVPLALVILGIATTAFAQDSPIVNQSPSRFTESHAWLGGTTLNGRSDFWDDNFQHFKASRGDLEGFVFAGDFIKHLDLHNALMLSSGFDFTSINEPSRDLRDHHGNPREHHLELATLSVTAGYVFYPAGTQRRLIPYVGAGGGLYMGQLQTYRSSYTTDDCDEDGNCRTAYIGSKDSFFATFGYFALAGLEVPVSSRTALVAEARYTQASARVGGDFKAHGDLDLSGTQYTLGLATRF